MTTVGEEGASIDKVFRMVESYTVRTVASYRDLVRKLYGQCLESKVLLAFRGQTAEYYTDDGQISLQPSLLRPGREPASSTKIIDAIRQYGTDAMSGVLHRGEPSAE